jgi:hypothetical protein
MEKSYFIFLFLILLSCSREEVQISQKLEGFWVNEDKMLLFRDSLMLHPIYDAPGLFEFNIINENLIVNNKEEYFVNSYDTCSIKLVSENELILMVGDDTTEFLKYVSTEGRFFNRLFFEVEPCHGTCPVFEVEIFSDGTVKYNGKAYTEIKGLKEYKLNTVIINEVNDLLEIVNILEYPEEKLSNPAGFPRFNLVVEYDDDLSISIVDGLFEGKYINVIKYFYFFERQLMEKSP